jgi:hypothetical protein
MVGPFDMMELTKTLEAIIPNDEQQDQHQSAATPITLKHSTSKLV